MRRRVSDQVVRRVGGREICVPVRTISQDGSPDAQGADLAVALDRSQSLKLGEPAELSTNVHVRRLFQRVGAVRGEPGAATKVTNDGWRALACAQEPQMG